MEIWLIFQTLSHIAIYINNKLRYHYIPVHLLPSPEARKHKVLATCFPLSRETRPEGLRTVSACLSVWELCTAARVCVCVRISAW